MDTAKSLAGPLVFAVITVVFGSLGVHYGSLWAQDLSNKAFVAACIAFQVPGAKS